MTKEQAIKRKAELEAELKQIEEIIQQPEVSKEDRFWGLVCGLQRKVDFKKYPYSIFWFNGEECRVEYDLKTGNLWLHYPTIWSVFEQEYGLSYQQIKAFIKAEVKEHFKMKGITPQCGWQVFWSSVKEHFKMKGITPSKSRLK